jgi:acetyl-CoA acyltransferase 1
MALQRLKQLSLHLTGSSATRLTALEQKRSDDVVITMAIRSPLTKAKKGALKDAT